MGFIVVDSQMAHFRQDRCHGLCMVLLTTEIENGGTARHPMRFKNTANSGTQTILMATIKGAGQNAPSGIKPFSVTRHPVSCVCSRLFLNSH